MIAQQKKENVERQKRHFKNIYNLIFGRDDGPRLYLFLAAASKSAYIDLLDSDNAKKKDNLEDDIVGL